MGHADLDLDAELDEILAESPMRPAPGGMRPVGMSANDVNHTSISRLLGDFSFAAGSCQEHCGYEAESRMSDAHSVASPSPYFPPPSPSSGMEAMLASLEADLHETGRSHSI